jgi:spermidine synthase
MPPSSPRLQLVQQASPSDILARGVTEIVAESNTPYQRCAIWQSDTIGRFILVDGDLQSTEMDLATYHEALVHPAMLCHPHPRRVLICGGGEGTTAREVLRYPSVEKVTMVDIDQEFTALCRQHLPEWSEGVWNDPRFCLVNEDIFTFLEQHSATYDVIIGDLTDRIDEIAPGRSFHSTRFYRTLYDHLAPNGVISTQAAVLVLWDWQNHALIRHNMAEIFPTLRSYRVAIDSFYVSWSFILASRRPLPPPAEFLKLFHDRLAVARIELLHFDAAALAACFLLNKRIRALIGATE